MKIRTLFIVSLIVIFAIAGIVIFLGLKYKTFARLNETEITALKEKNLQIIRTIQSDLDRHKYNTKDWANWDDSYNFLLGHLTEKNFHVHFSQDMLVNMNDLGMLFLSSDFRYIFSYSRDELKNEFDLVLTRLQDKKNLFLHALSEDNHQLLIYIEELKLHVLATIYAVTPTEDLSISDGFLITVSLIDQSFADRIGFVLGQPLGLSIKSIGITGFQCLEESTTLQFCDKVVLVNAGAAVLDVRIRDSEGKNDINFQAKVERPLNKQVVQVFRESLLVILVTGICVAIMNLLLIQMLIVRPTDSLAKEFSAFTTHRSLRKRLPSKGPQEIKKMTTAANAMLDEIEALHLKVESLSRTDELTGICNRRYFNELYNKEFRRALRGKYSLTLMMIDVDYFKQYNDHYGHSAGDDCLRRVSQILQNCLNRAGDVIARYGGEEFIILIPACTEKEATPLLQQIKASLAQTAIPHSYSEVSPVVTCSIGAISMIPQTPDDQHRLQVRADELLYQAKHAGRNQAMTSSQLSSG